MTDLKSGIRDTSHNHIQGASQTRLLVARQPILKIDQSFYGYELLFRGNWSDANSGTIATAQVIDETLNDIGLKTLLNGGVGFINFTHDLLLDDVYEVLPKDSIVIELLEDITVSNDVLLACKRLKKKGYKMALDDYVLDHTFGPLVELADFIKIDFLDTTELDRQQIQHNYENQDVQLIAEKVESHEHFQEAMQLGCSHVQGFYFCRPESILGVEIPSNKQNYLLLLTEVNHSEINFDRVEQIIKQEVSLFVKLLKYLNSAFIGLTTKIDSIKQAITLLGEQPLRKWVSLLVMIQLGHDKPTQLIRTTLVRARFCEVIGAHASIDVQSLDLFLVGLLSTMDAFLDRALDEGLIDMPVSIDSARRLLWDMCCR